MLVAFFDFLLGTLLGPAWSIYAAVAVFVCVLMGWIVWRAWSIYAGVFREPCRVSSGSFSPDGKEYDFVIVGGGTAGCVLASRLSEHKDTTVLLLEAGKPDLGVFFRLPILGATFMNTMHHWNLYTQPERELIQTGDGTAGSDERGRVLIQCRAKCLGGCSSLNLAIWHHGRPEDYDSWETKYNCKGWGWAQLKGYLKKCQGEGPFANKSGFFSTRLQKYATRASYRFVSACASALGIPMVGNFEVAPRRGVGRPRQMVFSDGFRCNAVCAYLTRKGDDGVRVCDRPNLTIATGIRAVRLQMQSEGKDSGSSKAKAKGVYFTHTSRGKSKSVLGLVSARREVLVCAGSVHSPHLLMNSGIGPIDAIYRSRFSGSFVSGNDDDDDTEDDQGCQIHLPGVGANLRDVASSGVIYEQKDTSIDKLVTSPMSIIKYLAGLPSPLHTNTLDSFAFATVAADSSKNDSSDRNDEADRLRQHTQREHDDTKRPEPEPEPTKEEADDRPNLMLSFQGTRFPFANITSYSQCISEGQTGDLPNAFTIHATLLRPESQGNIYLQNVQNMDDTLARPLISHNYLRASSDIKKMIEAIKLARRVGDSPHFDGVRGRELFPGPSVKTDEQIEDYLRRSSCHFYGTFVGTCRMGCGAEDKMAVVDTELKVINTDRLRVVDASVIPELITGFPHSTVAAIAEKAADLIKDHYKLH